MSKSQPIPSPTVIYSIPVYPVIYSTESMMNSTSTTYILYCVILLDLQSHVSDPNLHYYLHLCNYRSSSFSLRWEWNNIRKVLHDKTLMETFSQSVMKKYCNMNSKSPLSYIGWNSWGLSVDNIPQDIFWREKIQAVKLLSRNNDTHVVPIYIVTFHIMLIIFVFNNKNIVACHDKKLSFCIIYWVTFSVCMEWC